MNNIRQDAIVQVPRVGDIAVDADGVQWIVTAGQANNRSFNVSRWDFGWTDVITRDEDTGQWYMMMPPVRSGSDVITFTGRNVSDMLADNAKPDPQQVVAIGDALTATMTAHGYTADQATEKLRAAIEQLPKRVPGQSLTDAYAAEQLAEQEETRLKAQRLHDLHEWLSEWYISCVANCQLYKQRVYAEVLYFIETGRKPADNLNDMAEFEKNKYSDAEAAIEAQNRRTQ